MSTFNGKWVAPATLDETKIQIGHDTCLNGTDSVAAVIPMIKVNTSDFLEACIKPQSPFVPSAANDLVNVSYLNAAIAGQRDPKDACRLATTGPIVLATTALSAIDTIVPAAGDRILVKDQAAPSENGIYIAALGAWVRSTDADNILVTSEVSGGMSTMITEGSTNARKVYIMTADLSPANIGVDALPFAQVPNPANFLVPRTEKFTMVGGETFVDLAQTAEFESVSLVPMGGPQQEPLVDFTMAPFGSITRVTFAGGFAGLVGAGDVLVLEYSYATV